MSEPIRKRRRPAKSCRQCRERKIRCDRSQPCKPCMRSRAALKCTYDLDPRESGPDYAAEGDEDDSFDLPSRPLHGDDLQGEDDDDPQVSSSTLYNTASIPQHMASMNASAAAAAAAAPGAPGAADAVAPGSSTSTAAGTAHTRSPDPGKPAPIGKLRLQKGAEQSVAGAVRNLHHRLSHLEKRLITQAKDSAVSDKNVLGVVAPRPHLRVESVKTKVFGSSHWMHTLQQYTVLSEIQSQPTDSFDNDEEDVVQWFKEAYNARQFAKSRETSMLHDVMPDILATIPARDLCDQAIDGYVRTFEPVFRTLHLPSFLRDYEAFWQAPAASPSSFLMKLVMVLAIGGVFLPDPALSNQIRSVARGWMYTTQWWIFGPTERQAMSIDGVQVLCLALLARHANSFGGAASIATDALLKLSFTVGLNIDPATLPSIGPLEAEVRRRLWLTVQELAVLFSLDSTMPLLISPDEFETFPPGNIRDCDLGGNDKKRARSASSPYSNIDCSLQLLLYKSLPLRSRIVRQLNNGQQTHIYQKAVDNGNELNAHCREIAAHFEAVAAATAATSQPGVSSSSSSAPPFTPSDFHRKLLDVYLRRVILFVHRPFCMQARRDPRFFLSRKVCLESSMITTSHVHAMNLPQPPEDDFSRLGIRGSGFFKAALSSDAVSAISGEIVAQIEDEAAAREQPEDATGSGSGGTAAGKRPSTTTTASSSAAAAAAAAMSDPLVQLARAKREPLMRTLRHCHAQLRQIVALGRPSVKRHIFVSGVLAQIEALERGEDPLPRVTAALKAGLFDCVNLMRESGQCDTPSDFSQDWRHESAGSDFNYDPSSFFGFDFTSMATDMVLDDMQDLLNSPPEGGPGLDDSNLDMVDVSYFPGMQPGGGG